MNQAEILKKGAADGIIFSLNDQGDLKIAGGSAAIERWTDVIRENKTIIIESLRTMTMGRVAGCCVGCERLEVVEIMGELIPGCLYQAQGNFPEGWRRIPAGTARCIWTPAGAGRRTSRGMADIH